MKIKKKIVSMFCSAILLAGMTSVAMPDVQASVEQTKQVDGSYLTMKESASGSSRNEASKGEYIMVGECSITKAGRGRIYVYAGTTARRTVNLVSTIVYVDQYNEKDDAWDQIDAWRQDAQNDYYVSTSKYIKVDPGYFYRVRADHFAGMQYPYESTYSFTDGIKID
ncbi:MAG: hypothetical protein Q4B39_07650 [[Ruminococcus] gnavus]|nr:hypothetical protein [Mediterraneibacter gnavus]